MDLLCFERSLQFGGIDRVVLNGVAGPEHLRGFETRNRLDDGELHIDGQRRAHPVHINFVRVQALGLKKKLMRLLVWELDDFVFDGGAVPRANRLNLPAVHRRAMHIFADDAMRFLGGEGNVAGHLPVMMRHTLGTKTKRRGIGIAGLYCETRPINRSAVEPRRRSGLEPATAQPQFLQRFAKKYCWRFAGSSCRILLLAAVDEPIEKSAGGDNSGAGANGTAVAKSNSIGEKCGSRLPAPGSRQGTVGRFHD